MGRYGVTYLDVVNAATEIQSAGQNPTVDAVRQRLGTGSKSTIAPYLKQWRNKQFLEKHPSEASSDSEQNLHFQEKLTQVQGQLTQALIKNAFLQNEMNALYENINNYSILNETLGRELSKERQKNGTLKLKVTDYIEGLKDSVQTMMALSNNKLI